MHSSLTNQAKISARSVPHLETAVVAVKQLPGAAQEIMENLLRDFDGTDVCIDNVSIFSNSWSECLNRLKKVLTILESANFTIDPLKCEWAVQETDWLGCWLTPTCLKPWHREIDAVLNSELSKSCSPLLAPSHSAATCSADVHII
jgi:hypothetical protein